MIYQYLCRIPIKPKVCRVKQKQHDVNVKFIHDDHAFVDERFPVTISVTNMDTLELEIFVDVLLQPSEDDSSK